MNEMKVLLFFLSAVVLNSLSLFLSLVFVDLFLVRGYAFPSSIFCCTKESTQGKKSGVDECVNM